MALLLVPVGVYLLAYLHFFAAGHGWADFVALHRDMLAYHRGVGTPHAYSSRWWEWPLALRPVWYFVDEGRRQGRYVFGNGNPLLYWPMVPAVLWLLIDWWGRRPAASTILAIGFFGQWLPWALAPRGTFVYHFLPAVPFGCLALAVLVVGGWRAGGWRRWAGVGYVAAVALVFVLFYPLPTAQTLTPDRVDQRMLWESWR